MQSGYTSKPTKHMQARMSQRGIPGELVDLVRRHGQDDKWGKIVLNKKALHGLLDDVRNLQRLVIKALDKGGVVVVEAGSALITTYNADSFKRHRYGG